MKLFQYIKIVILCGPLIIYRHFKYNIKFAKHPEKYPLEFRYNKIREEIIKVLNRFHIDYNKKNFDVFSSLNSKALIISNHLSLVDPMCLIANSEKPVTFIAKKEVFKLPFVGKVATALEVFPLDRENLMKQISVIKEVVSYLKDPNKPSVIVYIEGTRNRNPENPCLEFHPGTVKIAQMAGVPLITYASYGTFRILSMKSYLPKYPISLSFITKYPLEETKKTQTTDLAISLKNEVDGEVDKLRLFDKNYITNLKIKKSRKELETRVDSRINS